MISGRLSAFAINPDSFASVQVTLFYHWPYGREFAAGDELQVVAVNHTSATRQSFISASRFSTVEPPDFDRIGPFGVFATPGNTFNQFFDLDAWPFNGNLDNEDFVLHITTPRS